MSGHISALLQVRKRWNSWQAEGPQQTVLVFGHSYCAPNQYTVLQRRSRKITSGMEQMLQFFGYFIFKCIVLSWVSLIGFLDGQLRPTKLYRRVDSIINTSVTTRHFVWHISPSSLQKHTHYYLSGQPDSPEKLNISLFYVSVSWTQRRSSIFTIAAS